MLGAVTLSLPEWPIYVYVMLASVLTILLASSPCICVLIWEEVFKGLYFSVYAGRTFAIMIGIWSLTASVWWWLLLALNLSFCPSGSLDRLISNWVLLSLISIMFFIPIVAIFVYASGKGERKYRSHRC